MQVDVIANDEEFKQRLKEHEAYRVLDAAHARHCYCCKECNTELWLSYHDIRQHTDKPLMPCGHRWSKLDTRQADWQAFKRHNPLPMKEV